MVDEIVGSILKVHKDLIDEFKDYQVICAFHGFGSIGYLVAAHMLESMDAESFSFYGDNSWFYNNNLESTLTAYRLRKSKTILITTRIPIFVTNFPKPFWDKFIEDIFNWNCRRYIILGGLKEDTRAYNSLDWAAFVPSRKWTELFGHERTFGEKLTMIGPLSGLLTMGTSTQKPVLGLLAYCNLETDPDAALYTLTQLEKIADITIPNKNELLVFDYSFLTAGLREVSEVLDDSGPFDDDDDGSYDINDLL